ncbi:scarecrow-like protein 9 [Vicia villosa]|uniref:scarecrow-like protein 9 n=1 Tax=Vicia villosa TaxID=3911 RepID=UPI00273AA52A|nr:scarecrow-like protein 9 [Vicia villosa]
MMDPHLNGFCGSTNEIRFGNQSYPVIQNQRFEFGSNLVSADCTPSSTITSVSTHEEPSPEDCEFSDAVLNYINNILMEEDMEDKTCMLQDSLDLQIAEKSFYEVIGEKYPDSVSVSPLGQLTSVCNQNECVGDSNFFDDYGTCVNDGDLSCIFTKNSFRGNSREVQFPQPDFQGNSVSQSSHSSTNSVKSTVEGLLDSPDSILHVSDQNNGSQPILQFQKGVEEANKFLPSGNGLFQNFDVAKFSILEPEVAKDELSVKVEKGERKSFLSKGRKHHYDDEGDVEENRSNKQAAIYSDPMLRSNLADAILLHSLGDGKKHFTARREALQTKNNMVPSNKSKARTSGKGRGKGKKQNGKKEVIDLRTLLVICAQAVAADDHKSAHELLKQIRQHSNPFGDGNQRLANIFADGLEARLAGTGSQIYKGLISKRTSAANYLKAYHLYLAACPFRKMTSFVSNVTIMNSAESSMRVHIVDFGILYGFQWPTLIQRLSLRPGGPPKLRITGIDFPQPGFRPAERIIETGSRLAAYAETFKVPFEYNAIAKKWETIQLEELKIDKDEYLVVTCFYRGKNLLDESVVVDSPRNKFLNLIRRIKPDIFIHGITNGAFNAPFFVTRFREALFHFSSLFDMLESIVPREDWERMLIEKEIFGKEALNVTACEGCERVERPETYRQWQVRILRAGFSQQTFGKKTVERAVEKVRTSYHKDFVIDEDSKWLLQGWKGRIVFALSCWKPA